MKTALLIERRSGLNEPSDPGPWYIRKFRVFPFCSASLKSKSNIVVVNDDILEFVFPLSRFVPRYLQLELLARIIFDNLFQ